jgi:hypothetical protein
VAVERYDLGDGLVLTFGDGSSRTPATWALRVVEGHADLRRYEYQRQLVITQAGIDAWVDGLPVSSAQRAMVLAAIARSRSGAPDESRP